MKRYIKTTLKEWKFNENFKIDSLVSENELLKKLSEEKINKLIENILSDKDFVKYKSEDFKIKTGGLSLVIIFDKYVIKVTDDQSEIRKIKSIKEHGKGLKYIYNFPHLIKEINFEKINLTCVVLDKFELVEKEINELIEKIGIESKKFLPEKISLTEQLKYTMGSIMLSFVEFKFRYNYKHEDGTIGSEQMGLQEGLTDIELEKEYKERLEWIKSKLNSTEIGYLNDIDKMYEEYDSIKEYLTQEDRLDISATNLAKFNGHLIVFDL